MQSGTIRCTAVASYTPRSVTRSGSGDSQAISASPIATAAVCRTPIARVFTTCGRPSLDVLSRAGLRLPVVGTAVPETRHQVLGHDLGDSSSAVVREVQEIVKQTRVFRHLAREIDQEQPLRGRDASRHIVV